MSAVRTSVPCQELNRLQLDLHQQTFSQQYSSIYFARLTALRPKVVHAGRKRWPNHPELSRVLDVRNDQNCWVIGTAYMTSNLKPNVMDDVTQLHTIVTASENSPYVSLENGDANDIQYSLEDSYGRVDCAGSIMYDAGVVTGVVMAALGHEDEAGRFVVIDVCFPETMPPTDSIPMSIDRKEDAAPEFLAVVSGLGLSNDGIEGIGLHQIVDYLRGALPSMSSSFDPTSIKRFMILGNCLAPAMEISDSSTPSVPVGKKKVKRYGYDTSSYNPNPTIQLDAFLHQLCSVVDVTLIPGPYDYSTNILPQQPLHPALLQNAKAWIGSSLQTTTNPTWLSIHNNLTLASSGQNIDDLRKYHPYKSSLQLMENTILWNHITPTSPDTLWCYPFTDRDTFVMDELPNLYLCGNQPKFGTKMIQSQSKSVRLVSVPEFRKTGIITLINLKNLDVRALVFPRKSDISEVTTPNVE
ncbi:DNA polymerase delta small subunit Cdc1 [Schizosaccharomyces osmophilus]|uniref:DNA-directed DNA polymerase n=1 Tax=Schizosaccharomyces osmophilus TaxID=2545709 RepID=A0AAF0AZ00_9SCHI|nr:DNA polymerase delta small subunit Cdc1 [Schizosaccharomyces osmophilus]WBW74974.1 DNA polymerase delta small subunit Cdc1 [Schizosaccharomyces osmophilus]